MSKYIKIHPEYFDEIIEDFKSMLASEKFSDGRISYSKSIGYVDRKAVLKFTEIAWLKMQGLVREFDKEIAWHGIAYRGKKKDEYLISDILVYPQEVTGATVNTDQKEYQTWLMEHDDEVFNNIRMQGHSHVNMQTSPSTVDLEHQEKILAQLDETMFYIFVIWNKRGERTIKIYDLAENILFETADITVKIVEEVIGVDRFINESRSMVVNKTVSVNQYSKSYLDDGNYRYGGYSSYEGYSSYGGYSSSYGYNRGYQSQKDKPLEVIPKGSESKTKKGKRCK